MRYPQRLFPLSRWLLLVMALLLLFILLSVLVRLHVSQEFDRAVLIGLHHWSSPFRDGLMRAITSLAGVAGMVLLTGLAMTGFWFKGYYRSAALILLSVGGAALLNTLLKVLVSRPRPDVWPPLTPEASYSFPSGHAMTSLALALCLVLLGWPSRWRWLTVGLAVGYVALVGLSRLYLGVHYPTDILAGWIMSTIWVLIVICGWPRLTQGTAIK